MNLPPNEADTLARWLPIIVRSPDVTEWERQFAASLIRRNRAGDIKITEKQGRVLRRLADKEREKAFKVVE